MRVTRTRPRTVAEAEAKITDLSAYPHRLYMLVPDSTDRYDDNGDPLLPAPSTSVETAELIGSKIRGSTRHTVMLDVDHPVVVVPSSTPGHYHVYIDVPVEHRPYERLLQALSEAGVVQSGWVQAALELGESVLRLPWVGKARGEASA